MAGSCQICSVLFALIVKWNSKLCVFLAGKYTSKLIAHRCTSQVILRLLVTHKKTTWTNSQTPPQAPIYEPPINAFCLIFSRFRYHLLGRKNASVYKNHPFFFCSDFPGLFVADSGQFFFITAHISQPPCEINAKDLPSEFGVPFSLYAPPHGRVQFIIGAGIPPPSTRTAIVTIAANFDLKDYLHSPPVIVHTQKIPNVAHFPPLSPGPGHAPKHTHRDAWYSIPICDILIFFLLPSSIPLKCRTVGSLGVGCVVALLLRGWRYSPPSRLCLSSYSLFGFFFFLPKMPI